MPENEETLRPGDMVQLTRPVHWPGVQRRLGKGVVVPPGATGRLGRLNEHWVIVFDEYPNDPDWPCILGFYPSELPPWIVPVGTIPAPETPLPELSDRQLISFTWQL